MRQYPRRAAPGPGAVRQCASDVGNRLGARGRQGFPEHTLRGNRRRQGATAAVSLDRQPRIAERDNVMTIAEAIGDFANERDRIERRTVPSTDKRCVGKEGVRAVRLRWSPETEKIKHTKL